MPSADTIDPKFRTYIETAYSPIPRDQFEKIIDNYLTLIESAGERKQPLDAVLDQTCKIIFRLFGFREILIGLKSRDDFHYRYAKLFGTSQESADVYRKIKYTTEDMISQDKFPHFKTGRLSELDPVEGLPEYEKDLFTRKFQLGESRKSQDEFHEGDYMDVWIRGTNGDLVGWIELLNPSDGSNFWHPYWGSPYLKDGPTMTPPEGSNRNNKRLWKGFLRSQAHSHQVGLLRLFDYRLLKYVQAGLQ
jgi:hypothetical protein